MQFFEDSFSPTIEAAVRLLPRCSEKVERDSGIVSFTTRLLVPTSRIGCLIGKGGTIVTEMRRLTKANIRILSKENLPKIASDDDEMVQVRGIVNLTSNFCFLCYQKLQGPIILNCGVFIFIFVLTRFPETLMLPRMLLCKHLHG